MREILFKAKRLDNAEWVEGNLLQTTAVSLKSFIVESSCYTFGKWDWTECVEVDSNTICQYTGLTDKNGNKIWENDILHLKEKIRTKTREILTTVDWDDRSGCFLFEEDANGCAVGLDAITNCGIYEIIENKGSKFDNPQLIGGGE